MGGLLPSPQRSIHTSGKMSETEAKTDAVAEKPTAEEIKGTKRPAEEGEVEAKKQKTNGSANGAEAEANGDAEEEHDGEEEDEGDEEEDLDEEDIDEEAREKREKKRRTSKERKRMKRTHNHRHLLFNINAKHYHRLNSSSSRQNHLISIIIFPRRHIHIGQSSRLLHTPSTSLLTYLLQDSQQQSPPSLPRVSEQLT